MFGLFIFDNPFGEIRIYVAPEQYLEYENIMFSFQFNLNPLMQEKGKFRKRK